MTRTITTDGPNVAAKSATISVYEFGDHKVRTAGTLDAPLFCAADVCEVLGIANARDAVSRLPQHDVEPVGIADTQGKNRTSSFVTEAGLYKLILRSRKPQAEEFVEWITRDVLPSIRRKGYYSAIEAAQERETERLLAECFPNLPSKSEPIFRALIAALVRLRRMGETGNPPWARMLASWVYGWAIRVDGQQPRRRLLNPNPCGSRTDASMFSGVALESVQHVVNVGTAFAGPHISATWESWRMKMELTFGTKPVQLPFVVPLAEFPAAGRDPEATE
jgi:prophage antirepressor-like protein